MATIKRILGIASGGKTSRVSGTASGGATERMPHSLLLLEGDESGHLLLEGDASHISDDSLKLEGDVYSVADSTLTRRVSL